jgi:hypothetical protein
MSRPRCPNCRKPIAYQTDCIYAPKIPHSHWPIAGWSYNGNMMVTAKRYFEVPTEGGKFERRLYSVNVWDGESYASRHGYFCSITCAARYGRRAFESTQTRPALRVVS